jgi:hypothetical protein
MMWRLRFEPGNWPNGKKASPSHSKIAIFAIPTPKEKELKAMNRNVAMNFSLLHTSEIKNITKSSWR